MNSGSKKMECWEHPDMLAVLRSWARNFLTMEKIAKNIGISRDTLYEWIKKSPQITEALKQGGAIAVAKAEDKLMEKIEQGDITAIIFLLKCKRKTIYGPKNWVGIESDIQRENADLYQEVVTVQESRIKMNEVEKEGKRTNHKIKESIKTQQIFRPFVR